MELGGRDQRGLVIGGLTDGVVPILDSSGETVGASFVVSTTGLIATCAHVVGDGPVTIVFHAMGEQRQAGIEPEYWRGRDDGDVAFLGSKVR